MASANHVEAVSFSDANHGYIAGGFGTDGVLTRTTNGGLTWHATIIPNHFMHGVFASVDNASVSAATDSFDGLYGSTDSGASWNPTSPVTPYGDTSFWDGAYLSGGRRVVVGQRAANSQYAVIASSVGAGSWTVDFDGPIHPAPDESSPVPTTYAWMASIDAAPGGNVAWAVGTEHDGGSTGAALGLIYRTTTAGSAWATQTAPTLTADITCVSAVDAQTAFIGTAAHAVLRTTNGVDWQSLNLASTMPAVRAIDALDADHVVVVGDNGRIAWSMNASAADPTWHYSTTATTHALHGVNMFDASTWIVAGDDETILRTVDGGTTWSGSTGLAVPSVKITSPTAVFASDSTTVSIEGTASDGPGIGVAQVQYRLQRKNGEFWSGSAWVSSSDTWLSANTSDGWDHWNAAATIDSTASLGGALTINARSRDGLGQYSPSAVVGSMKDSGITPYAPSVICGYGSSVTIGGVLASNGSPVAGKPVTLKSLAGTVLGTTSTSGSGSFDFVVSPSSVTSYVLSFAGDTEYGDSSATVVVMPKAKVATPVVPSRVSHTKSFKTYIDLWPKHTAGTKPVTLCYQRLEHGHWKTRKTIGAKAATYKSWSRCSASVKIAAGKWRVWGVDSDAAHAPTTSARRSFTVR